MEWNVWQFFTYEFSHNYDERWQQPKHNIFNCLFLGIFFRFVFKTRKKYFFVLTLPLHTNYLYWKVKAKYIVDEDNENKILFSVLLFYFEEKHEKNISENRLFIISGRKTHWNICNGEALMLTNNIQTKNWIEFQKGTHDNFFPKTL